MQLGSNVVLLHAACITASEFVAPKVRNLLAIMPAWRKPCLVLFIGDLIELSWYFSPERRLQYEKPSSVDSQNPWLQLKPHV
jgi:hypothetical protein